jgi:hypothetical protein
MLARLRSDHDFFMKELATLRTRITRELENLPPRLAKDIDLEFER